MTASGENGMNIGDKVAFLRRPQSYPSGVERVEIIETHMSWVFLAGERVYKLKKPVRRSFLDFSTLEARRLDAEREVRLNRRLADDTYIGVVPLVRDGAGRLRLGGEGRVVDWLVEMHRLPESLTLSAVIAAGTLRPQDIDRICGVLLEFYRRRPPLSLGDAEYRQLFADAIAENHEVLARESFGLPAEILRRLTSQQLRFMEEQGELLEARTAGGRVIEGHGDLRPEHVFLTDPPLIIDCLEFNREFRIIDPVDELTYLGLECERLGAGWIAAHVLDSYRRETGDDCCPELVTFYRLFRCCLRAKIAVWHIEDHTVDNHEKWRRRAEEYLRLAEAG